MGRIRTRDSRVLTIRMLHFIVTFVANSDMDLQIEALVQSIQVEEPALENPKFVETFQAEGDDMQIIEKHGEPQEYKGPIVHVTARDGDEDSLK
ncbi:hypothetical protein ACH5RR_003364 [Cinchona calisaya]|uniref:Uncharacterized protein n=1 Tax=Cinchona calisaya TaxID=153742 RepID=A0ABD3AUZ7_9GENT